MMFQCKFICYGKYTLMCGTDGGRRCAFGGQCVPKNSVFSLELFGDPKSSPKIKFISLARVVQYETFPQ